MSNIKKKLIYFLLVSFFLINIIFLINYKDIIWDEASYISIGKYIYSSGKFGLNEVLRPIILPLILGFLWKSGFNIILASKVLAIFFSMGVIYLTYKIGKELFGEKEGLIAATLVSITPVFIEYSSKILTGIPSVFFALLSLNFILKKKYVLGGVFGAVCFLTRFPQAIFIISILIVLLINLIRKPCKKNLKNLILYSLTMFILFFLYSLYNYFFYRNLTSSWIHSAFRPFYYLFWNYKYVTDLGSYSMPISYYLTELFVSNPLMILFYFVGLLYLFKEKNFKKNTYILVLSIVFFMVLSYLKNKQIRHAIIMLPYLALISAKGITSLREYITGTFKKYYYFFILFLVFIFSIFLISQVNFNKESSLMVSEYYGFLKKNPVEEKIFITDPLISAYYDHSVDASYYDLSTALDKNLKKENYDLIFYTERSFPCIESDFVCLEKRDEIMKFLLIHYDLVFQKNYYGDEYYIFSGVDYIPKISENQLMINYGLSQKVSISKKPYDKLPVIIVLEDFPSLTSNLSEIWEEEKYIDLMNYFINLNISVSADIIPLHLKNLNNSQVQKLRKSDFVFIQNGYSHNETYPMSYQEEYLSISKGKEIIKNLLNANVSAFTPPYYFSTPTKINALTDLGFDIYITNSGDSVNVPFNRYDQTMTLISVWETKKIKTKEELTEEVKIIEEYRDYLLVSVYYYMFENLSVIKDFIDLTKENVYMNIYEYKEWTDFVNSIEFEEKNNLISLSGENNNLSKMLTLTFFGDGNFTINSKLREINIKNKNSEESINLCLNKMCVELEPNETINLKI